MDKKIVLSSFVYKFTERLAVKGIGLIINIIMARLLTPEDFGQVAILTVFINLSLTIINGGLSAALVQDKKVDERDYSTVFYISLAVSVILVISLYILAPTIANYYESNVLILPLRVYSISLIFGAFNSVQTAKMQREMRFKSMMKCHLAATFLSGVLGAILAYLKMGIWALVIYYFSNVVFCSMAMLLVEKWIPRLCFSAKRAKELFGFGWKMLVSALMSSVYNDIYSLIIADRFSTASLGYYNRGKQFPDLMVYTLNDTIGGVMFPTMSRVQGDNTRLKSLLRKSVSSGALVIFPVMIGMAIISEPLISIVFGEKWLLAVPYMKIICIGNVTMPIAMYNLNAIKAMGRSDIYMRLEAVRRIVMIIILALSVVFFDTVVAIAVGRMISFWIDFAIISVPIKRLLNYSLFEQFVDMSKSICASLIMGIIVFLCGMINLPIVISICIQILAGVITYSISCVLLKNESFQEGIQMVKALIKH